MRDEFNEFADEATARWLVERKLDADYADRALMGELGSASSGGRMLTGVAARAKDKEAQAERKKEEAALSLILESLEETLARLDARIAELDVEIAELREELTREEQRSEQAFERMHALEDIVNETDGEALSDTNRIELQELLGDKAKDINDDALLITLAQAQIAEDLHTGMQSYIRSEEIRAEIVEKEAVRDELIENRQALADDPSISPEERSRITDEALKQSMQSNFQAAEAAREGLKVETNAQAQIATDHLDESLSGDESTFDLNDASELKVPPLTPLP